MATLKDIKDGIIANLEADADLMNDIDDNIYEGQREGTLDFPNLNVFIVEENESDDTYPNQKITSTWAIMGSMKEFDDTTIYDDIFTLKNKVVKAICADRRLGGVADHLMVTNIRYDSELSPVRNFIIMIQVKSTQSSTART